VGQQFVELLDRLRPDAREHVPKPSERVHLRQFARRKETPQDCHRRATAITSYEGPVAPAHRDAAQAPLGVVVVDGQVAIFQVRYRCTGKQSMVDGFPVGVIAGVGQAQWFTTRGLVKTFGLVQQHVLPFAFIRPDIATTASGNSALSFFLSRHPRLPEGRFGRRTHLGEFPNRLSEVLKNDQAAESS
jgi:hypothetical protein